MARPPVPKATATTTSGPPRGLIGGVAALVVAIIAVVVYLGFRSDGLDASGSANALPEGGGVVLNPEVTDVPEVHVYEDFQCPFCGQLEETSGEAIAEAAAAGEIKLTYTFMSFLDGALGNDSSVRAANASVCSADADVLTSFVAGVFAQQPANEGDGYPDEVFVDVAEDVGVEGADLETFTSCVEDRRYADYVSDMQERSTADGVTSSPVITINGETISNEQLTALLQDPTAFDPIIADAS